MTNRRRLILLSDYDQSLVGTLSLVRLFYYKHLPKPDRLRSYFADALGRFPRFASEIVRTTAGAFAIAPLEHWPTLELRAPVKWTPEQFAAEQVSLFVDKLQGLPGEPVIAASLTDVDGGAMIGISLSHVVADAYSLSLFLSCWAEQSAKGGVSGDAYHRPAPRRAFGIDAAEISDLQELDEAACQRLQRIREMRRWFSVLHFDRAHLESIRRDLSTNEFVPSVNEALTAFLLHRYAPKIIGRSRDFRLRMPVDVRGAHPAVPRDFIGNGFVEAIVPIDEASASPLAAADTAQRIHRAVQEVKRRSNIDALRRLHGARVEFAVAARPAFDRKTDVVSTNLTRLRMHELDFGTGPPLRYFCPLAASAGFAITSVNDGVEVHFITEIGTVA